MRIYLNLPNRVAIEQLNGTWVHKPNVFWIEYPDEAKNHTIVKPMGENPTDYHAVKEINVLAGCEILK